MLSLDHDELWNKCTVAPTKPPEAETDVKEDEEEKSNHAPQQPLSTASSTNQGEISREEALVNLTERTKYPIMQENGQRRYGPPPGWIGAAPGRGCEVFIGKIPRDCFEDELVPVFERVGKIYMFRLMMDFSGCNRGYGFCIYTNREDRRRAVAQLDNFEIRKGRVLGVCLSFDNCRLFVGCIPKSKTKQEIMEEMCKVTEGVKDVITYVNGQDRNKNRGFAFVEYETHKAAAMARRKLIPSRVHLWGHQIAVDWAEPERELEEEEDNSLATKSRVLYVKNVSAQTSEEMLQQLCERAVNLCQPAAACCVVERVKKLKDFAFVHFQERSQAVTALDLLDGRVVDGSRLEVSWARQADRCAGVCAVPARPNNQLQWQLRQRSGQAAADLAKNGARRLAPAISKPAPLEPAQPAPIVQKFHELALHLGLGQPSFVTGVHGAQAGFSVQISFANFDGVFTGSLPMPTRSQAVAAAIKNAVEWLFAATRQHKQPPDAHDRHRPTFFQL